MYKLALNSFTPCQPVEMAVFKDKNENGSYTIRTEPALGWCNRYDEESGDIDCVLMIRGMKVAKDDPFFHDHVFSLDELYWRYFFKL